MVTMIFHHRDNRSAGYLFFIYVFSLLSILFLLTGCLSAANGQIVNSMVNGQALSSFDHSFENKINDVCSEQVMWLVEGTAAVVSAKVYYPCSPVQRCPVVIFSHGLGSSSERCAYLGKMWASRGLISIHLDHPSSNESVWRGKLQAKEILKNVYQRYWHGRDRALAIRFVIDRLTSKEGVLDRGFVGNPIALLMADSSRIGIAGNDLGALATLLLAGQLPPDNGPSLKDDRIMAVVALSPPVYCTNTMAPLVYSGIKVPFLSVAGTKDDGIIGTTKAWQRRIPFDSITGTVHFHLTLEGADHSVYSGIRPRTQRTPTNHSQYQRTIMDVTTAFWALMLMQDHQAAALLLSKADQISVHNGVLEYRWK